MGQWQDAADRHLVAPWSQNYGDVPRRASLGDTRGAIDGTAASWGSQATMLVQKAAALATYKQEKRDSRQPPSPRAKPSEPASACVLSYKSIAPPACTTIFASKPTAQCRRGLYPRVDDGPGGPSSCNARRGSPPRLSHVRRRHSQGQYGAGEVIIWDEGWYSSPRVPIRAKRSQTARSNSSCTARSCTANLRGQDQAERRREW